MEILLHVHEENVSVQEIKKNRTLVIRHMSVIEILLWVIRYGLWLFN